MDLVDQVSTLKFFFLPVHTSEEELVLLSQDVQSAGRGAGAIHQLLPLSTKRRAICILAFVHFRNMGDNPAGDREVAKRSRLLFFRGTNPLRTG
jgi:hypothetical protein